MLTQKAIRRKIKVVRNIQKITRAMKMVATAKLKRAQERVVQSRPYAIRMLELVASLATLVERATHVYLTPRPIKTRGLVVITSEKGLCGGYNGNLIRLAVSTLESWAGTRYELFTLGRKGTDFFRRRDYPVVKALPFPGVNARAAELTGIADAISSWYVSGAVDEVFFVYAVFKNVVAQTPTVVRLLPIDPASLRSQSTSKRAVDHEVEPDAETVLSELLPRYFRYQVHQYLLEAMASENGARTTAMTAATDNADELLESLTLSYNKARQWAITTELLDIVGGAEALKNVH
ncbi:MAG: ATP synthase F1 subunit gamma [Candidatus Riflebacteria bacterium]|nr:ATP synthase F1 subunit gamma [Candidatus Riflebacteria bacterium]